METNFNDRSEGPVAKTIEKQTAKLPSDLFLWAALASMGVSAALEYMDRKETALFVGQWAPALLLFGIYNKIVKVMGSDQYDQGQEKQGQRQGYNAPGRKNQNRNIPVNQKEYQPS